MIIEALSQLFSLNLSWFAEIVLNNLHWVFALFAFTVISGKEFGTGNFVRNFVFLVGFLWAFVSIASLIGLSIFNAGIFFIVNSLIIIFWPKELSKKHPSLQLSIVVLSFVVFSILLTFGII